MARPLGNRKPITPGQRRHLPRRSQPHPNRPGGFRHGPHSRRNYQRHQIFRTFLHHGGAPIKCPANHFSLSQTRRDHFMNRRANLAETFPKLRCRSQQSLATKLLLGRLAFLSQQPFIEFWIVVGVGPRIMFRIRIDGQLRLTAFRFHSVNHFLR